MTAYIRVMSLGAALTHKRACLPCSWRINLSPFTKDFRAWEALDAKWNFSAALLQEQSLSLDSSIWIMMCLTMVRLWVTIKAGPPTNFLSNCGYETTLTKRVARPMGWVSVLVSHKQDLCRADDSPVIEKKKHSNFSPWLIFWILEIFISQQVRIRWGVAAQVFPPPPPPPPSRSNLPFVTS